jgi:rhodanese-related sulfurtransferase
MGARQWILRLTVLVGLAGVVAGADALVLRPPAPTAPKPASQEGEPTPASTNALTLEDVRLAYESNGVFFIDARPVSQFTEGHVPGAFHIDVEAFRQGRPDVLEFLPVDAEIIIYCGGGECDASHMVERMMRSHGYEKLRIFEEGFPAWLKAELPVETGEPTQ